MNLEFQIQKEADGTLRPAGTNDPRPYDDFQAPQTSRNPRPMTKKPIHCDSEHCGLPAICSVEFHFFCVGHFIAYCYERLDRCPKFPSADANEESAISVDRFLQECSQQAASLVDPIRGLDNLERARLFDIFLWASELASKRSQFTKPEVIDTAYRINRRES
jgi:hypothetical protein